VEERLLALLRLALKHSASDIHFDIRKQEVDISMRIDGQIKKVKTKFGDFRLIRYLQYLANLDVGVLNEGQTGQFNMNVDGIEVSLRFAIINRLEWSNAVLRILNSQLQVDINCLSLLKKQNDYFKQITQQSSGLILLSGPTGSGKTTTLYTLLKSISYKKIFTIEDPIEVIHDEFIQLSVNDSIGFSYSQGIKQILRHDPDVIMIGEIRDEKAAKGAVEAANTGHLVLSSIHASKASSVISRMFEFGVNENELYENLICICGQRLMSNPINKRKIVLYEIMDKAELNYFKQHRHNSDTFLDIDSQIIKGEQNGFIV